MTRRRGRFLPLALAAFVVGCGGSSAPGPAGANVAALPNLIGELKLKDGGARTNSAKAIGRMGAEAREAVPALIPLLKDRDVAARAAAAHALGRIGPDARDALPQLQTLSK